MKFAAAPKSSAYLNQNVSIVFFCSAPSLP